VIREDDFVGRYGGEEFAVVLLNSDVTGAALAAERIRFAVVSPACEWQVDEASEAVQLKITGSIGIAVFGEHGTTREMLIERADSAMYFAKRNGRNRACIADSEEMRAAQNETIPTQSTEIRTAQVLTAAAAARDFETGEHAHRLVLLAEAVARHLRLPEEDLHLIRLGALLHDIGKIGIPDGILHKPGPLTADEWVIMRQHPEIGHQILSMAGGVSQALAIIVLAHHERYDGKGYPHGISGEAIPIAARILSVIDAFDAMVSRRPYKEPVGMSEACNELRRCSGAQFDPQVVDAFCYVVEEQGALAV
jgi:putative nucleotidyltransferase with HDIG domain